ncbi:MAG: hypothetical protein ACRD5I_05150 [Candidatus Acidiferrales bacterium]
MKIRLISLLLALGLLCVPLSGAAQFPKIKKPKEEKPAATTTTESKETTSSAPATSSNTMKKVAWADNGISFEVPDNWEQTTMEKDIASFFLPNSADNIGASMTISRLGKDFPAAQSLKAYQDSAAKQKSEGTLAKWENQNIGAAKGLNQLEAAKGDDICRLTWIGYQNRGGWNMVTVIFSSKASGMSNHEATFRKVLGTFKVE